MITRSPIIGHDRREMPENAGKPFPLTIHYDDMRNWSEPRVDWHWHREPEFATVVRGTVIVSTNHGERAFSAGEGYFINRDVLHRVCAGPGELPVMLTHLLDGSLIGGAPGSVFEQKYVLPVVTCRELEMLPLLPEQPHCRFILDRLRHAYDAADLEEDGFEMVARNAYSDAWLHLMKAAAPMLTAAPVAERPADVRVKQMLVFIRDNHAEKLTLDDIAASAGVSSRECLRCFSQVLHTTPFGYLIDYRLHAAAEDLARTAQSVTEIALAHGFASSGYFAKLFREKYNMTPLEYRRARGAK